jgi:pseudouridine synthase
MMRLNKFLARNGIASRRKADDLIRLGAVQINGKVIDELGVQVDPQKDHVRVEGKRVHVSKAPPVFILLNKPPNVMVTRHDPQGRPTVYEYLKKVPKNVFNVGRLDFETEGMLLFTNDGEVAFQMTHPQFSVPRTYLCKVKGAPEEKQLEKMRRGMTIEGVRLKPAKVSVQKRAKENTWLELTLTEGRNRQIRQMCSFLGHSVLRLRRMAFGPLQLGNLQAGRFRYLAQEEIVALREFLNGKAQAKGIVPAKRQPKTKTKKPPPQSRSGKEKRGWAVSKAKGRKKTKRVERTKNSKKSLQKGRKP